MSKLIFLTFSIPVKTEVKEPRFLNGLKQAELGEVLSCRVNEETGPALFDQSQRN